MDKLKRLNTIRTICYSFFLAICVFWLWDNGFPGFINWPILTLAILLLLQLFFKIKRVDFILGFILTMLSFYMMLAVTSDLGKHMDKRKPIANLAEFLTFGYGLFGLALTSGLVLIYVYYARKRLLEEQEIKKALHA